MITLPVARALARTGLAWHPARGDRFVLPDRGMDGEVFVLSDMTIEAHDFPTGRVLGFNGTTEWALDSVAAYEALWLPAEPQLRDGLDGRFVSLTRDGPDWVVTARDDLGPCHLACPDAEQAYALTLLAVRATTARDVLPVAAHGLARALEAVGPPEAPGWDARSGDGVRTVAQAVAAALGHDDVGAWRVVLADLLTTWSGPASGDTAVTEAGAQGVLVDLLVATWDVATAVVSGAGVPSLGESGAARPTGVEARHVGLDARCVAIALQHVRSWGTAPAGASVQEGMQQEFLRRVGRLPVA